MKSQQNQVAEVGSPPPPARLLNSFTQEDVVRAAAAEASPSLRWHAADWHARKDTIVALAFHPVEFGARPEALDARLVVLQSRAGKLGLVAETKVDLTHADCPNESGEPAGGDDRAPELAFDLAAYTIAPGQTAIGVRFTCAKTFSAAEGLETRLSLFELQGGTLRQVFDEKIGSTNYDRLSGDTSTTTGIVTVQRQRSLPSTRQPTSTSRKINQTKARRPCSNDRQVRGRCAGSSSPSGPAEPHCSGPGAEAGGHVVIGALGAPNYSASDR